MQCIQTDIAEWKYLGNGKIKTDNWLIVEREVSEHREAGQGLRPPLQWGCGCFEAVLVALPDWRR